MEVIIGIFGVSVLMFSVKLFEGWLLLLVGLVVMVVKMCVMFFSGVFGVKC